MRILFCCPLYWPYVGGLELLAARLLPTLAGRGIEFLVVTTHDNLQLPDDDTLEGIPIRRLPFLEALRGRDPAKILATRRRVVEMQRAFDPDVVHVADVAPSALFHVDRRGAERAPLLVSLHSEIGALSAGDGQSLVRRLLREADWVTGCTAAVLDQGRRSVPEVAAHSSVIYNGLAAPPGAPSPLPFDPPRLLCLGRLITAKAFDVALRAFALLLPRHAAARLTIAGDGPERERLERLAADLGIAGAVEFRGWVAPATVPAILDRATILLAPSRAEGFSLAALQAAQMARPVIASDAGGLPEVVEHDRTGLIVTAEDPPALARGVAALLDHPDRAAALGAAARRRALDKFSHEACADAYESLYRRLGSAGGGC